MSQVTKIFIFLGIVFVLLSFSVLGMVFVALF